MSKQQFSKRERGKKNLHKTQAPKYGFCPECQRPIHNRGAHAEACDGVPIMRCESYTYSAGSFGVRKQCLRPWGHNDGHIY